MKSSTVFGRITAALSSRLSMGALLLGGIAASPALLAQCPTGQQLINTVTATGMVRAVPVFGNAGMVASGITIRTGYRYAMTASGSIRVGVIGETGTPPDGWTPQGPAGNGFPDPTAPTFELLFRVGPNGAWQELGSGLAMALLHDHDAPGSMIYFGINDNKLSDNTGVFMVMLTEYVMGTRCAAIPVPLPHPVGGGGVIIPTPTTPMLPKPVTGPCANITPDGKRQSFQFTMICPGNFTRVVPTEACTWSDAHTQALAFAKADGCLLNTN